MVKGHRVPEEIRAVPCFMRYASKSQTWEPKIRRKAAGKRHFPATQLLHCCNFVFSCCSAAFGKKDVCTAEKRMLQCNFSSATFRNLQRNFSLCLWHVAGVGFEGWGLGLAEIRLAVWDGAYHGRAKSSFSVQAR